jgi:hypothetical protein
VQHISLNTADWNFSEEFGGENSIPILLENLKSFYLCDISPYLPRISLLPIDLKKNHKK